MQLSLHGYHKVGIVPVSYTPEVDFEPYFARGAFAGAVKCGAASAGGGLAIGMEAAGLHPYGALIGDMLLSITVPIGVVGGLAVHTPEAQAQRIEKLIDQALEKDAFQLNFARRIADHAVFFPTVHHHLLLDTGPNSKTSVPDYRALEAEGFDVIIEPAVQEIRLEGGEQKDKLALFISAKVRIVDTSDNTSLITYTLPCRSREKTMAAWVHSSGRALAYAIADGLNELAWRVVYKSFGRSPG